jgi:YidC/Oxa1 family membrane protein insertase
MKPFYEAIAWLVVHLHSGLAHIFGSSSGAAWGLAIVLLTIAMRLVLFPLFVKQIKNQRAMQLLQPKMKELQAKYKNDKEKLNQEMMALWKEHGANPLAGCLPLVLQIPVFIALFRVLNSLKPGCGSTSPTCITVHGSQFDHHYGISAHLVASAANAKVFGVPIFAAFNSTQDTLSKVGAHTTTVKIVTAVMIVLMGASTFFTQRQLMARNKASATQQSDQMQQTQKLMLYVLPLTFAIFGYRFPLGVLLYWLTTNIWSMGQQAIVIRRMDIGGPAAATPAGGSVGPSGPAPGAKPVRPSTPSTPSTPSAPAASPAAAPSPSSGPRPGGANRRPGGGNRRKRRGGRR